MNCQLNQFFETTNQEFTVIRNGSITSGPGPTGGWNRMVNVGGNQLTGYYSDKATCNVTPGALPGRWKTPLVWESLCYGVGTQRQLSLLELYGNACGSNSASFCNSLKDQGGHSRRPIACGGTDPDIITYNPQQAAEQGLQGTFESMQAEADTIASQLVLDTRKRIFLVALLVLLVIVIILIAFN